MIVCDTSGVLAVIDASQRWHEAARAAIQTEPGPYLLSPFVLAELDYLLTKNVGATAAREFLTEVVAGSYRLESFSPSDIEAALDVMARYSNLSIGLADASLVVLAERVGTNRILTLDERHFRTLRPRRCGSFLLVPLDSPKVRPTSRR